MQRGKVTKQRGLFASFEFSECSISNKDFICSGKKILLTKIVNKTRITNSARKRRGNVSKISPSQAGMLLLPNSWLAEGPLCLCHFPFVFFAKFVILAIFVIFVNKHVAVAGKILVTFVKFATLVSS